MAVYIPYGVPARVKTAVDGLTGGQMADMTVYLGIDTSDCPDSDHYDYFRQKIFDFFYEPEAPADGSRWINVETGIKCTVTKTMNRSPGGGIGWPLVEFVPDGRKRSSLLPHDPWWPLRDWRRDWVPE